MRSRTIVLFAVTGVLAAGATLGVGIVGTGHDPERGGADYVREHPVGVPASVRTVVVSLDMPMPSAHSRMLSAKLIAGRLPDAPTMAEVMTDTDCSPDARKISRCRNEMRLPSGETIVVRHPHDMRDVPCLAPGEYVQLIPTA